MILLLHNGAVAQVFLAELAVSPQRLIGFIVLLPLIALSLTVHEYWHARAADLLGDPTGRYQGRCTLNPLAHLDPIGTIAMFFAPLGWARPVPINPLNFDNPRRGMTLSAAAGPLSNLAMGLLVALALRIIAAAGLEAGPGGGAAEAPPAFSTWLYAAMGGFTYMNISLCLFNLIPIYPLDGHHIFREMLQGESRRRFEEMQGYGVLVLLALIVLGGELLTRIICQPALRIATAAAGREAMARVMLAFEALHPYLPW